MPRTRPLDPLEIRVLGALLEKEQTTPEYYPLTLNAVVAACNQKSNRDPITDLAAHEVAQTLERLRQDVLVWRSEGARSERWQHSLDRRWELDSARKAVMTLLLLRGPQTAGELRTRGERLHGFATVGEVETVLAALAAGQDALVHELPRQPGQRETRWAHLVGLADAVSASQAMERERLGSPPVAARPSAPAPPAGPAPAPAGGAGLEARVAALEAEVAALRRRVDELEG